MGQIASCLRSVSSVRVDGRGSCRPPTRRVRLRTRCWQSALRRSRSSTGRPPRSVGVCSTPGMPNLWPSAWRRGGTRRRADSGQLRHQRRHRSRLPNQSAAKCNWWPSGWLRPLATDTRLTLRATRTSSPISCRSSKPSALQPVRLPRNLRRLARSGRTESLHAGRLCVPRCPVVRRSVPRDRGGGCDSLASESLRQISVEIGSAGNWQITHDAQRLHSIARHGVRSVVTAIGAEEEGGTLAITAPSRSSRAE